MKKPMFFVTVFIILFSSLSVNAQLLQDSISTTHTLITPKFLKAGDSIVIVAPAGVLLEKKDVIDAAKELAESWNLHVKIAQHVFDQNDHFAGTDADRSSDFQEALDNPNIKAIWCARGGYGSVRIIDRLDFSSFLKNPKWIVGFSDVTVFHNRLNLLGIQSIHAMMPVSMQFEINNKESKNSLKKALFGKELRYEIASSKFNKKGKAKGKLVGGNLTILASMLGSDNQLQTDGKILFIEEIGEYKYAIDRMLQSLKRAGYFTHIKALIVGDMSSIKKNNPSWGGTIEELILTLISEYNFPVFFDFPAGHEADNRALIFGKEVRVEVSKETSKIVFE